MSTSKSPADEIDQLFEELAQLLKNPDVGAVLAQRGVNTSLALLAADGLHAYLRGEKVRAATDLGDFADEVKARLAQAKKDAPLVIPHPNPVAGATYSAAELAETNDSVIVLDQRLLPEREVYLELRDLPALCEAIRTLTVRGAPAIGIAAAYAMVIAANTGVALEEAAAALLATRPTAVNLRHGVETMLAAAARCTKMGQERVAELASTARDYHRADVAACRAIGRHGAALLPAQGTVLTHCNAGALATGGYGTALGVIRAAVEAGKRIDVLADETRPLLQGARLTAWELQRDGIPVRVLTDSMAAVMMARGGIVAVVVGADRIAKNGDAANKIGTYGLACLAHAHGIPFYVAAPWSTVDLACADGAAIPIEERRADEVTHLGDRRVVPDGVPVVNPSFDVTPARLIRRIVTERGAVEPGSLAAS